jgi:hypothetical protein
MTRKTRTIDGGSEREADREGGGQPEAAGPPVPQSRAKTRRAAGKLQAVMELFTVFPAKD